MVTCKCHGRWLLQGLPCPLSTSNKRYWRLRVAVWLLLGRLVGGKDAASPSLRKAQQPALLTKRLKAIAAFLASGQTHRCDVPRVRGGLQLSWSEFSQKWRGRPVVLQSRGSAFPPQQGLPSRDASEILAVDRFRRAFGDRRIKTNNGHFDHLRHKEVTTVEEYLTRNVSDSNLFFADHAYALHAEVLQELNLTSAEGGVAVAGTEVAAELLAGFDARPIFSLGLKGSATMYHRHLETWQYLLAGKKAWWLTSGDALPEGSGGDPCVALSVLPPPPKRGSTRQPLFCVQEAGEMLYFGDQLNHATCNFEDFALGFGAQGRSDDWPRLKVAARNGDVKELRKLLEEGGNVNARDDKGNNALHMAVAGGHLSAVELLAGSGIELRRKDEGGRPVLSSAAERGDVAMVRFLEEAGAGIKGKDKNDAQALHWAALSGHRDIIDFLLAKRADANTQDRNGTRPIHFAALESDEATVEHLVRQRADPRVATSSGRTPLHLAAGVGHSEIASQLLKLRVPSEAADGHGNTPLHFAASQDRIGVIRRLLEGAANVNAVSADGMSPMHLAAALGHRTALQALLSGGGRLEAQDASGRRPLHAAAQQGHAAALQFLLKRRADYSAKDSAAATALAMASARGHLRAKEVLLGAASSGAASRGVEL
eukprot:TRINITY_DN37017_c0_g1_i2.p1 TRINITY_DN37017_c0_g1~~TRINITY_DN37017_c0_g1_i2.p1  ORF type:complete len:665 (-),score=135.62 TRINITY_DN37017_c0_g1_i2:231-2192(-)